MLIFGLGKDIFKAVIITALSCACVEFTKWGVEELREYRKHKQKESQPEPQEENPQQEINYPENPQG